MNPDDFDLGLVDREQPPEDKPQTRDEWRADVEALAGQLQDAAWSCPSCWEERLPHGDGCPECGTVSALAEALRQFVRSRRESVAEPAIVIARRL